MVYLFNIELWLQKYLEMRIDDCNILNIFQNRKYLQKIISAKNNIVIFSHLNPYDFSYLANILDKLELLIIFGKVSKIVFLSSYGVYAPKYDFIYNEEDRIEPINRIGVNAVFCENVLRYYYQLYDIDIFILRIFNLYGPLQNDTTIVPNLFKSILLNKEIKIGDIKKKRDFIYIDDLANLIDKIISFNLKKEIKIYNIGTSIETSIKKLISIISKIARKEPNISFDSEKIRDEYDYDYVVADISRADKELNWNPEITLPEGLYLMYQWLLGKDY